MRKTTTAIATALFLAAALWAQYPEFPREEPPDRLPDGRSRDMALIKHSQEKSLEDIAEIIELARDIEKELTENSGYVVSLTSIEKTERIEKLAQDLGKRMKRGR